MRSVRDRTVCDADRSNYRRIFAMLKVASAAIAGRGSGVPRRLMRSETERLIIRTTSAMQALAS